MPPLTYLSGVFEGLGYSACNGEAGMELQDKQILQGWPGQRKKYCV